MARNLNHWASLKHPTLFMMALSHHKNRKPLSTIFGISDFSKNDVPVPAPVARQSSGDSLNLGKLSPEFLQRYYLCQIILSESRDGLRFDWVHTRLFQR